MLNLEGFNAIVSQINDVLWTYVVISLLLFAGVYFTIRTKFVQIRYVGEMFKLISHGAGMKTEGHEISSFQAFCVSTASRVGVGNIAGIAIAIVTGGPGAVFWMWLIAILGAATGFVESTLAQIYKVPRDDKKGYLGGPAYYINNVLKAPWVAVFFAILISVTYGLIFNSVQSNTISLSVQKAFNVDATMVGIVIAAVSALVIFGGMSRIARVTEYLVPIMAGIYLLIAFGIMIYNIAELPAILAKIFNSALNVEAMSGGALGIAIMTGIKRGLFSNEAGMGSVPNAAATAEVTHPVKQGLIQAFGVFVDTLFICTATVFIVFLSGDYSSTGLTGIQLIQHDLSLYFGSAANAGVALLVLLFAFTSIVGNYYYGEVNIKHLSENPIYLNIFRICVVGMIFFGAIAQLDLVWNLADLFMALMVVINVIAILLLGRYAYVALDDYTKQKKAGKDPKFNANVLPNLKGIHWWRDKDEI